MRDTLLLIGRILLVVIFIASGLGKLANLSGTAAYIASQGLPLPSVLAPLVGIVELGLGLAVAIGFQTRVAAWLLALFSLLTILFVHHYWNMTGDARALNEIQAMKNLAMIGGFIILAGVGPGRFSVDRN
ncbi:DoxX family protein [Microvirga sp. c23x22]|uniref:DoxX family protein n=2 Tax=Microvirga terricola TaxID=2719797 RepID=A0ABX0VBX4_9HYPH|nr:DoxX family protein [Microvirga terricola]